ncbi:flagellar assembly protein FliH [Halomonas shantousis]
MSEQRPERPAAAYGAAHWQRWEMDSLASAGEDRRDMQQAIDARRRLAAKRSAELEAQQRKAYDTGHQKGYEAGHGEGYEAGYQKGLAEGRTAGEQELSRQTHQTLAPLAGLAAEFRDALAQLDDQLADHLTELALTVGRQLALETLEARPEAVVNLVRELLHTEPALSGRPRLWLHPADLTMVKAHLGAELDAQGWQTLPDETLTRGGCRASSASGGFDASVEARWTAILDQRRRRTQAPDMPVRNDPHE